MDSNNTERAILSALLLNNAVWPQLTGVDPDDFSLEANRQIFCVSADLLHAGQPADVITVADELERRSDLEKVGGLAYLSELVTGGLERKDVRPWVKILKRKAGLRRVRLETEAISQAAAAPNADISTLSRRLKDLGHEAAEYGDTALQIRSVADIPDICDCDINPPEWLVEGLIPGGALILWAGTDGCAKTWLSLALVAAVAEGGEFLGRQCVHSVAVYLDYENPGHEVRARVQKLSGRNPWLKIWGNWTAQGPPQIGDPLLLKLCKETQPLLVIDPLRLAHDADENDASEMTPTMRHLRSYVAAGATVIILHHVAKTEGSGYRGSSAIRGACDLAMLQEMSGDGLIALKVQKNRFGERRTFTIAPDFEKGVFEVTDSPAVAEGRNAERDIQNAIETTPGMTQEEIVKRVHINRAKGCAILRSKEGMLWRSEVGARGSRRYFPMAAVPVVPSCSGAPRTLGTTEPAIPAVPHPLGWNSGTGQEYPADPEKETVN